MTKRDVLNAIKEVAMQDVDGMFNDEVSAQDVIAFVDTSIEQLDNKAAKAKERAAKAKAEGDEIRSKVAAVLTDEYQTIADITAQVDVEDITPAKVSARLSQLVKLNQCHKTKIKTADGRTINGYAAGPDTDSDAE